MRGHEAPQRLGRLGSLCVILGEDRRRRGLGRGIGKRLVIAVDPGALHRHEQVLEQHLRWLRMARGRGRPWLRPRNRQQDG